MKNLYKLSTNHQYRVLFKTTPGEVAINSEKLGGQAEWAKNQLKDKTSTALDTLGDLTKLKIFTKEDVIALLKTKEAQQNWTQTNGGKPQNSARYVMALQAGLKIIGENIGDIDAMYGEGTEKVVEKFQEKHGLKVDGAPGPETIGKMLELLGKLEDKEKPKKGNDEKNNVIKPIIKKPKKKTKKEEISKEKSSADDVYRLIGEEFDFNGMGNEEKISRRKFARRIWEICQEANVDIPNANKLNKFLRSVSDKDGNVDYGDYFLTLEEKDNADNKKIEDAFKKFYLGNSNIENPAKNKKNETPEEVINKESNEGIQIKINWEKHPEFKNENSKKFMQALLENKAALQKELDISDDLYKDLMALSFADLQFESNGGNIWNAKSIIKTALIPSLPGMIATAFNPKVAKNTITASLFDRFLDDKKSKGLTQVKIGRQGKETREILGKFEIDGKTDLWDPQKAAIATIIIKSQQYKWDRKKYKKTNPSLSDLEIMEYIYYNNKQLKDQTATPETNKRIQKSKEYFQIGKDIIGHTGTSFTEKIAGNKTKPEKEKIKRNIDWSGYEGKNNFIPDKTPYKKYGCASFTIRENGKKEGKPDQNVINGNAWVQSNNIIWDGGWEIFNAFNGTKLANIEPDFLPIKGDTKTAKANSKKYSKKISGYIGETVKGKEVDKKNLRVGDIVNLYYPPSSKFPTAYPIGVKNQKSGNISTPVTHVGQISEKNGNMYVTHNVHGVIRSHPIDALIEGTKTAKNNKGIKIVGVYRPNTKAAQDFIKKQQD